MMKNRLLPIAALATLAAACTTYDDDGVVTTMDDDLPVTADPTIVDTNDTPGVVGNKYDDKDGGVPVTTDTDVTYRATGTDPYWTLNVGNKLTFVNHDTNDIVVEMAPTPAKSGTKTTYANGRIVATFSVADCVDTKSGNTYPETATVTVDGGTLTGCSGPLSLFLDPSRNSDPGDLDVDGVK